jgi:hypothetical protein
MLLITLRQKVGAILKMARCIRSKSPKGFHAAFVANRILLLRGAVG